MNIPAPLIAAILTTLIFLSSFFSLSETAHIALSKIRLKNLLKKGAKNAPIVQRLVLNMDTFIATILVGNNIVNTAISAIVTVLFVERFGSSWGIVISTFVTVFFILILCEITPKILATQYPGNMALITAPLMEKIIKIFRPVAVIFSGISKFLIRLFGGSVKPRSPLITEEELRLMIEVGKDEGVLSDEERKMFHRIFEFGDMKVSDVMVPKDKMVAININLSQEEALGLISEEGHSRFPVYKDSLDNIVGIVYIRDLLYILIEKGLVVFNDIIHSVYFVPQDKKVSELLIDFQKMKVQIAIAVDKNKKTVGMVTLEDLLEEIVGEMEEAPLARR